MASITSSEFGKPLQSILLAKNMRVTPGERITPLAVERSGLPNAGLGACWGWTPGGNVALDCLNRIDSVNKKDTEFLIDCVGFTTPSIGHLRLYVTPAIGVANITMPLIVVPNVAESKSDQTYQLSQVFDRGQTVDVYPGAKEFDAEAGTMWIVIQSPVAYTWSPSAGSTLKLTPATIAVNYVAGPPLVQATWTIAI